ncbi:hypothetical protein [Armatimonas sp.]|uniref:hypothetical protein n=1 Tax=Armatimonas sp. TaxID=1872638 RepID=UPI0037522607
MKKRLVLVIALATFLTFGGIGCHRQTPEEMKKEELRTGAEYFLKGDYKKAAIHKRKLVDLGGSSINDRYDLAVTLVKAGDKDEAKVLFEEIIKEKKEPISDAASRALSRLK